MAASASTVPVMIAWYAGRKLVDRPVNGLGARLAGKSAAACPLVVPRGGRKAIAQRRLRFVAVDEPAVVLGWLPSAVKPRPGSTHMTASIHETTSLRDHSGTELDTEVTQRVVDVGLTLEETAAVAAD